MNRLQHQITEHVSTLTNDWLWSKDFKSVANVAKITDSIEQLKLSDDDFLELQSILKGLYYFIRKFD